MDLEKCKITKKIGNLHGEILLVGIEEIFFVMDSTLLFPPRTQMLRFSQGEFKPEFLAKNLDRQNPLS